MEGERSPAQVYALVIGATLTPTKGYVSVDSEITYRPGGSLDAGQIYESNSILLRALFDKCGVSIGAVEHCADDASSIEAALRRSGCRNGTAIPPG